MSASMPPHQSSLLLGLLHDGLLKSMQFSCQELYLQKKSNKLINDTAGILMLPIILATVSGIPHTGKSCKCISLLTYSIKVNPEGFRC